MFIERLVKQDLIEFFKTNNINMHMSQSVCTKEEYLYVAADYEEHSLQNHRMNDFDSTTGSPYKWRKYLYSKFGEEYFEAYSKYLDSEKEERLKELL